MKLSNKITDKIIEHSMYLYLLLMLFSKGEGIRNLLIFGGFALWVMTLRQRENLYLLKERTSLWVFAYAGLTLFSVVFSIDPKLSLDAYKGEVLKFLMLYCMMTTVLGEELKLRKVIFISFIVLSLITLIGYYSYLFLDTPMLTAKTPILHTWHNEFARYLNMLLPLSFILYFIWQKRVLKYVLTLMIVISIMALILSTSRGGYVAFLSIALIWSYYLSKRKGHNFKKIFAPIMLVFLIAVIFSFAVLPDVRTRFANSIEEASTFNERTELWARALHAAKDRPVFGWGYGNSIFRRPEPYMDTHYTDLPLKGTHNMFIKVLFHQGLVGLIPYVLLILTAISVFWKEAFRSKGTKSYMFIACCAILIGNYVIQNMLENVIRLQYLAVVLGLGMAAKGTDENSNT